MVAVTLEYNNNNAVVIGILDAIAKMPDVRISETFVPSNVKTAEKDFSRLSLSEQAKFLNRSINTGVSAMTMEEIVQEVRDYRNGK
jgi:tRNA A37 N6-isopentenylltransferase MiaA